MGDVDRRQAHITGPILPTGSALSYGMPMLAWDDLRTFLAIARAGNLSAAARTLGVAQPTMGRRLEALHARAGARLLERTPSGYRLTAAGERIMGAVERMEAEALLVERVVTGEDVRLEGQVRVTSIGSFGSRLLIPLFATLQQKHPGIAIELAVDARSLSLARREADIAVRLARFEGHEIVARKVADVAHGLYASADYLERHGQPELSSGCVGHRIVTVQDDQTALPEAAWLARVASRAAVSLRSNSRAVQLQAALDGMGLAGLPRAFADGVPGLVRIATDNDPPPMRELWIGVHRDTRHAPRIRAVLDHLSDGLKAARPSLAPDASS